MGVLKYQTCPQCGRELKRTRENFKRSVNKDDIGTIYINDAYENEEALKAAQKMKEYLTKTYPNKVFKLYSEGFKKGGTIKTANARKWKHEDGGCFNLLGRTVKKHQTGGKTNFFNSLAGLAVISGVTNLISTVALNKKVQANAEALKALNEADWAEIEREIIQLSLLKRNQKFQLWMTDYLSGRTMDQPSLIVAEHEGSELLNRELAEGKQGLKNKNKQIDAQADAETSGNWGNTITGILQNGLGIAGNYMVNKGANNAAPSTSGSSVYKLDSFWSNPTLKTSTPTYSFNTTLTPPKTNYNFLNQ